MLITMMRGIKPCYAVCTYIPITRLCLQHEAHSGRQDHGGLYDHDEQIDLRKRSVNLKIMKISNTIR